MAASLRSARPGLDAIGKKVYRLSRLCHKDNGSRPACQALAGEVRVVLRAKVKNIKVPQKIIQPFSQEDVLRLLACCDPATRKGARDRALILLEKAFKAILVRKGEESPPRIHDLVVLAAVQGRRRHSSAT